MASRMCLTRLPIARWSITHPSICRVTPYRSRESLPDRLAHAAQGKLGDRPTLGAAEDNPDRRLFVWVAGDQRR
jgi:hypothetical protein